MEADELRKSMIQEVKQAAAEAKEKVEASRLLDRLRDQVTVVRARFRAINQGSERRKLDLINRAIDRLMGELKLAAALEDADEGATRSQDLEKQADVIDRVGQKNYGPRRHLSGEGGEGPKGSRRGSRAGGGSKHAKAHS